MVKVKPKEKIVAMSMDNQVRLSLILTKLPALITCDKAWIIEDIKQVISNSIEIEKTN